VDITKLYLTIRFTFSTPFSLSVQCMTEFLRAFPYHFSTRLLTPPGVTAMFR
jgi:hypothetical protein